MKYFSFLGGYLDLIWVICWLDGYALHTCGVQNGGNINGAHSIIYGFNPVVCGYAVKFSPHAQLIYVDVHDDKAIDKLDMPIAPILWISSSYGFEELPFASWQPFSGNILEIRRPPDDIFDEDLDKDMHGTENLC